MAVNVIVSAPDGPGEVKAVADGASLTLAPGMTVRVEVYDAAASKSIFVDPADLNAAVADGDVTVDLPDGQSIVLRGYGETILEQALGGGLLHQQTASSDAGQVFGSQVSIDYTGDGLEASRVNLYFDKHDNLDVDGLFAALETELGLRPAGDPAVPNITGMNVVEQPLDLSDLLLEGAGSLPVQSVGSDAVIGENKVYADLAGLWGAEEEGMAVNDNDTIISA